jgi:hypothetical protein
MVNLLTKTAQHIIDPGPTFNCRMPLFHGDQVKSAGDLKNPLLDLEFGRELAYFIAKDSAPQEGPVLRGKPTSAYTVQLGDSELYLFVTGTPSRPWAVARDRAGSREIFWYGEYEELPFDLKLFAKPEGVKVEESTQ